MISAVTTWYVYALCEPETAEIRYVGKSKNPAARLGTHYARPTSEGMEKWLSSLASMPVVKVLSRHDTSESASKEEARVILALSIGGRLLNRTFVPKKEIPKPTTFTGLGTRVRELRKAAGISGNKLAAMVGVSQASISHTENNPDVQISAHIAVHISRVLNTTVEYLVTGEGEP